MPSPETAASLPASTGPRVAVVGAMGFGLVHLRRLHDLVAEGRCVLSAVVDPRPLQGEALRLAAGADQHGDLADLLATDRPDVVVIATPIATHAPLALAALRAGCHVLLEKPPTSSLAEYEQLLDVVTQTGLACQVGFQSNGSDAYDVIAAAIDAGEIGDLVGIGVAGTWVRTTSYYARARWAGRRRLDGVEVVDGVVTNPLAHAVAAALRIAGAERADDVAVVETELYHANDIEADDTSSVHIRTARGLPIVLGLTLCASAPLDPGTSAEVDPRVVVHGTQGRIELRYTADVVEVDGTAGRRTVSCTRRSVLDNLLDHAADPTVELLSPLVRTGGFMQVLEAIRTAPDPAPIPAGLAQWHEDGAGRHVVVRDVEHWCQRVAEELRTFTGLGAPWAPADAVLATLRVDGAQVAAYVDGAGTPRLDSPRPHLHPVRTRGGVVVSDAAPADHTWHAGVGIAVPDVAGHNLWGGPTFRRGPGYTWRPDHGRITHEGWADGEAGTGGAQDAGRRVERLAWRGHDGATLLTETRTLTWAPSTAGWVLGLETTLANDGDRDVPLGSPGSNGRPGAGYGGFFWRLPACTGVHVRTATARGEREVHGSTAPWLAWSATAADGDFTLVLAAATAETAGDPWFVRVDDYPGLGSSLAWERPLVVRPGGSVTRGFRVLVADGLLPDEAVAAAGERLSSR